MMAAARLHRHLMAAATLLAAASAIAAPNTKVFIGNNSSLPPIRRRDGSQLTPRALHGHTVLVNFWASWCVACRTELPSLERLAAKRGDLVVIAASVDTDQRAALKAFVGRYPHLNLAFASLEEVQQYGALGMPYSVILDKEGREVVRMPRALEWDRAVGTNLIMRAQTTRAPRQS
jgi:thiol-disulfide isomerase/thioredoxin